MQTEILSTGSVIYDNVKLGNNVIIGANCIIGSIAESKKFIDKPKKDVIIGDDTVLHGKVTIDSGTVEETKIGKRVWLMKGVHIGHDSDVGDDVVLSPHVCIGGHVKIGDGTNIGMGAIIHQRVEIPKGCMIGMGTIITKKTKMREGYVYVGNPARELRKNLR